MKKSLAQFVKKTLRFIIRLSLVVAIFILGFTAHRLIQPEPTPSRVRGYEGFDWPEPQTEAGCSDLIPYEKLMEVLPANIPDWETQEPPYGSCFAHQTYAYTMARKTWLKGKAVLETKVMDVRHAPQLIAGLKEAVRFHEEDSYHYRRGLTGPSYEGFEAFYYSEGRGEIQLTVANRFWVSIEGYQLEDPDILRQALRRFGFKRLINLSRSGGD